MPPANDVERIHELETDTSLLKKETEIQNKILDKLDNTVESLHDLVEAMHRMLSIHEEKFKNQDRINSGFDSLIDERREQSIKAIEDLSERVNETETRIVEKINEIKSDILKTAASVVETTAAVSKAAANATEVAEKAARTAAETKTAIETNMNSSKKKITFDTLRDIFFTWKYIIIGLLCATAIVTGKWKFIESLFGISGITN